MRIQSSKVLEPADARHSAHIPQVTALSEAYQALQTGVVDGTENPPSNLYTQRMHEVQKHRLLSNHGYLGYAVIVNKSFWDKLPSDIRQGLEKAMAEATAYANTHLRAGKRAGDRSRSKSPAGPRSMTLTPQEQAAWHTALEPVTHEMASRVGKDLIDDVPEGNQGQHQLAASLGYASHSRSAGRDTDRNFSWRLHTLSIFVAVRPSLRVSASRLLILVCRRSTSSWAQELCIYHVRVDVQSSAPPMECVPVSTSVLTWRSARVDARSCHRHRSVRLAVRRPVHRRDRQLRRSLRLDIWARHRPGIHHDLELAGMGRLPRHPGPAAVLMCFRFLQVA